MLIQRIKISNYKTYLSLDLDLTVDDDRPIILIGGANGGGKTTLFEAISGALYGLKIENKEHFMELLNQGALNTAKPEISLQITFVGKVLGQQQKYILKRVYQLNPQGKPLESVSLNMNGNMYVYGTMTAPKDRVKADHKSGFSTGISIFVSLMLNSFSKRFLPSGLSNLIFALISSFARICNLRLLFFPLQIVLIL